MIDLDAEFSKALKAAHDVLNATYADYCASRTGTSSEYHEIRMQIAIFGYEMCSELVGFIRNQPTGFAQCVALKGLVHKLFEYDQLLSAHLVRRMDVLIKAPNPVASAEMRTERRNWKAQLKRLKGWADVRNSATGHYGRDTSKQIELLSSLNVAQVMEVSLAFLRCNNAANYCFAVSAPKGGA